MAEIWRELALSVGCRSSQTFERNQRSEVQPINGSLRNIPKRENLHQKVITFGIVIRLRNAPIHFLSSLRTRKFKPTVNEDNEIALSNEGSRMTKDTYADSGQASGQRRASGFNADCEGDVTELVGVVNESCGI
jgi:hypothetical protein